jgi:hypothetical protein
VTQTPIGQEAKLTVLRSGRKEEMTIKVGSLVEAMALLASAVKEPLGAEVGSPNPKEAEIRPRWRPWSGDHHVDPKGALGQAGIHRLAAPRPILNPIVNYVVIIPSMVFKGASWSISLHRSSSVLLLEKNIIFRQRNEDGGGRKNGVTENTVILGIWPDGPQNRPQV